MARHVLFCAAAVLSAVCLAHAATQQTARAPITKTNEATATVTIEAIDSTSRLITFKNDADGTEDMASLLAGDIRRALDFFKTHPVARVDEHRVGYHH